MTTHFFRYILAAACCATLWSCAGESGHENQPDEPTGKPVDVSFIVRAPQADPVTGEYFLEQAPEQPGELINSWWAVFVSGGKVHAIMTSAGNSTGTLATQTPAADGTVDTPVNADTFHGSLAAGTYDVYTFANVTRSEVQTACNITIAEGDAAPDFANTSWSSLANTGSEAPDRLIPMSGHTRIKVTGRSEETFALEVVRMLAKVELSFKNATAEPLKVNQFWMLPTAEGPVKLIHDPQGDAPVILDATTASSLKYVFDTPTVMQPGCEFKDGAHGHFYARESAASLHPTGRYVLQVDVSRNDNSRDTLVALTDRTFLQFINRNDYVQVPITLSDWIVDFDVLFYPPIGGYPAVLKETKGKEFYFRFGTQGVFVIVPKIRIAAEGTPFLQPGQYELTIDNIEAPDGFFAANPAVSDTDELTGEMSSLTGTAAVTITVTPHVNAGQTAFSYTRTIYIIRD